MLVVVGFLLFNDFPLVSYRFIFDHQSFSFVLNEVTKHVETVPLVYLFPFEQFSNFSETRPDFLN